MIEKFDKSNFVSEDTFRILDVDGKQKGIYTLEYTEKVIDESGLDGIIINKNIKPIILRLGDFQKCAYEEHKKQKEQDKKRKAAIKQVKEVKFHLGIAQNDYNYKVQHIQDFLNSNCKVKIEIFLRGREVSMKDSAMNLLNNILSNFSDENIYIKSKINDLPCAINLYVEKK